MMHAPQIPQRITDASHRCQAAFSALCRYEAEVVSEAFWNQCTLSASEQAAHVQLQQAYRLASDTLQDISIEEYERAWTMIHKESYDRV